MTPAISSVLLRVKLVDSPDDLFKEVEIIPRGELFSAIKAMPYVEFVATRYWQAVAMTVKEKAGMRCQVCNSPSFLEAHHRTYENHGAEHLFLEDLTCLCRVCHSKFHKAKKAETEVKPVLSSSPLAPGEKPSKFFRKAAMKLSISAYVLHAKGMAEVGRMIAQYDAQRKFRKMEKKIRKEERRLRRDAVYIQR